MSTDRLSAEHSTRTGNCVNNSRPAIVRFEESRNNHFVEPIASGNKISARMALLLKHHEEQRALQRRVWEAERQALEHEIRLLQKKHSLLMIQSSKRRDTNKRSQVATAVVDDHNTSSLDYNKLPTDIRPAEAADGLASQRRTTIVVSKQQANRSQAVPADHTIDSSHIDRIQQWNRVS